MLSSVFTRAIIRSLAHLLLEYHDEDTVMGGAAACLQTRARKLNELLYCTLFAFCVCADEFTTFRGVLWCVVVCCGVKP